MKRSFLARLVSLLALTVILIFGPAPFTWAEEKPVRVGILHSLSGTMAISETPLKDVALMTIEQINAEGGVLGRRIEPIVVDPASNWPLFADKARKLLEQYRVAAVFGCWTSVSRKAVLPVFEELGGLLFYPLQYEGQELSENIFYTGAAPNQQSIPALEYLLSEAGGSIERFFLLGTDYIYPRTTNNILTNFLISRGIAAENITEAYTPFGHRDYQEIVEQIRSFSKSGRTAVISTINGDSNIAFYRELAKQDITAEQIPVMAFSIGEEELRTLDTSALAGHFAAWNYFMSIDSPENQHFREQWAEYSKRRLLAGAERPLTTDPMEATHIGIRLWKQAVEQAGSFAPEKVREALGGQSLRAPSGVEVNMDEQNHHLHQPVFIGRIRQDGQFDVIWQSPENIRAMPRNPHYQAQ